MFLLFCLSVCQIVSAKDVISNLISTYSVKDGADYKFIDKETIIGPIREAMAKDSTKNQADIEKMQQEFPIETVTILTLKDCTKDIWNDFTQDFNTSYKDGSNGYKTQMTVKKDGVVHIIVKGDEPIKSELIMVVIKYDDRAIVKVTGKLSETEINNITQQYKE